jgi:SET domain-containing protein
MNEKFYIGNNDFGKGIFAKGSIKNGEVVLKFTGPIVTEKQAEERDTAKYGKVIGNGLQIGHDKYIYLDDPGRMVNHSCNPNAGIRGDTVLVAIRDIEKDEEIRFDYSTTMDEDDWTMRCKCGEKNCRKEIKDFKYLPKETREKYLKLGIVQRFIVKNYS